MAIADTALWIIERNSSRDLSLNAIAAACNVSRSHLANAFGTASGWPVMAYVRARRLSEAAKRLAAGAPDILAVALDHGYGSHEAFTRAFRDQFGTTPEEVRNGGGTDGLQLVAPLRLRDGPARAVAPDLRTLGRMHLVGLSAPCSFASTIAIPAQWQTFMSEHYADIPNKTRGMPIGLCRAADDEGGFEYMCAARVGAAASPNRPLCHVQIAAGRYAVFEHRDHVSTIFDTYTAIWNVALPAASLTAGNGPALEFHHDDFDPATGLGGLTLWIPLAEGSGGTET